MADEQHRWLDRETAERLLSGLPPQADDPAARDRAEQLARTLDALTPPPLTSDELPGEAAALAAFRKVSEERAARAAADGTSRPATAGTSDTGLVRIGAPQEDRTGTSRGSRWTRPLRFGLAAALAAGMVGGAAALAGTGVLPASGGPGSDPAASVTATATSPERPLVSPPPTHGAPGGATPDGTAAQPSHPAAGTGRPGDSGTPDGKPTGRPAQPGADSGNPEGRFGRGWKQLASACRDLRDGKDLDGDRRRMLAGAAGSAGRVGTYCKGVLAAADLGSRHDNDAKGLDQDSRERDGRDGRGDHEDGDDDKDGDKRGGHGRHGGSGRHAGKGQDRRGGHGRPGTGRGDRHHHRAAAPGPAHRVSSPDDFGISAAVRL